MHTAAAGGGGGEGGGGEGGGERSGLKRKESDESIKSSECSDIASTPSSCDSSDQATLPGQVEPHQQEQGEKIEIKLKLKPLPTSYTKEPWTGQTVPIRETGDEVETTKTDGDHLDTAATTNTSAAPAASLTGRSKKKQRAQMKREEKLKRRQREKSQRKQHFSQESNSEDKVSLTSSSASSTDYLEEDITADQEEKRTGEEEEEDEDEEEQTFSQSADLAEIRPTSPKVETDEKPVFLPPSVASVDQPESHGDSAALFAVAGSGQPQSQSTTACTEQPMSSCSSEPTSSPSLVDAITCTALEQEQLSVEEEEIAVVGEEKEKERKTSSTPAVPFPAVKQENPIPTVVPAKEQEGSDEVEKEKNEANDEEEDKEEVEEKVEYAPQSRKKLSIPSEMPEKPPKAHQGHSSSLYPDSSVKQSQQHISSPKRSQSAPVKDTANSTAVPPVAKLDKAAKLKPALDETPASKEVSVAKPEEQKVTRPQNLKLTEPGGSKATGPASVEVDGPAREGGGDDGNGPALSTPHELAASLLSKLQRGKLKNEREKPGEGVSEDNSAKNTGTTHAKKDRGVLDIPPERHSTLSKDAQPFVPSYQHHYPGPLPPNYQLRPPFPRGQHQILTPPYDFFPMRPSTVYLPEEAGYPERFEHRRPPRKRDHQKHQSKGSFTPSPPYHYSHDGSHYRERPYVLRGLSGGGGRGGGGGGLYDDWGSHDGGSGLDMLEEEHAWYRMRQHAAARERPHNLPHLSSSSSARQPTHAVRHRSPLDPSGSLWQSARPHSLPLDTADSPWDQIGSYRSPGSAYREDIAAEQAVSRRQRLLRLQQLQYLAQQDQLGLDSHDQLYLHHRRPPSPQDVLDLSHLREQQQLESSLGLHPFSCDGDEGSVLSSRTAHSHRLQEHHHQQQQDDLSFLLATSSSAPLSRAPGSFREQHSKAVGSSRLLQASSQGLADLLSGGDTSSSWTSRTAEVCRTCPGTLL